MRQWFATRAPREQWLLGTGALIAALLLLWAFVVHPLQDSRRTSAESVAAAERDLAWMRDSVAGLRGASPLAGNGGSGRSLLAEIDSSARAAGLGAQMGSVEPQPNGRVAVSFSAVPFDALMRWLEPFAAAQGAGLESFSARTGNTAGLVDARATLVEAGRQ